MQIAQLKYTLEEYCKVKAAQPYRHDQVHDLPYCPAVNKPNLLRTRTDGHTYIHIHWADHTFRSCYRLKANFGRALVSVICKVLSDYSGNSHCSSPVHAQLMNLSLVYLSKLIQDTFSKTLNPYRLITTRVTQFQGVSSRIADVPS